MKSLVMLIAILSLLGCDSLINPYVRQNNQLDEAYNSGQLTYAEYASLKMQNQQLYQQSMSDSMAMLQRSQAITQQSYQVTPVHTPTMVHTSCRKLGDSVICDSF